MKTPKILLLSMVSGFCSLAQASSEGSYMIPAGQYLESPVTFEVERAKLKHDGDLLSLSYKLPNFIAGEEKRFDLTGVAKGEGPWTITGEDVRGVCSDTNGQIACTLFYIPTKELEDGSKVFDIDPEQAAQHIDRMNLSDERAQQLKAASFSLMHEAIGVITPDNMD